MTLLDQLITSGRIVDLVVVFIVIEIAVLTLWRRRTGGGIGFARLLSLIAPGLAIFLALRAALMDHGTLAIAGWMLVSLVAHLNDVRLRLKEQSAGRSGDRSGSHN